MSSLPAPKPSPATTERMPPFFAGIDIGGTNIKLGIVDNHGQVAAYRSIPTQEELGSTAAAKRCAQNLIEMAAEAGLTKDAVVRVGLATPGPMDLHAGRLICPGNLPAWHNAPVRDQFAEATGLSVTFANDANAAAWGEFWRGTGAQSHSMLMVTLGTGVGGGVVIGDRLLEGVHSCGAEIGHIIIDSSDDAPRNSLGIRGTLEGYCGAYGVVGQVVRLLEASKSPSTLRGLEEVTPLTVAKAAEAGDELAMQVVLNTARLLSCGIATVVHTIDPDLVVLGGGLNFGGAGSDLGERFLDEVRRQTQQRLIPSLRGTIPIDFAQLGSDAGFIGAAGLARRDAE